MLVKAQRSYGKWFTNCKNWVQINLVKSDGNYNFSEEAKAKLVKKLGIKVLIKLKITFISFFNYKK